MQLDLGADMEGAVCPPSGFIRQHWRRLLPHWPLPVLSVLILVQRSPIPIDDYTAAVEQNKQQLRDRSIHLLQPLIGQIHQCQHQAVLFDPQTGFPYQSTDQGIPLNDVAVIYDLLGDCLGYDLKQCGECYCLVHPRWGSQVYPAIVVCSALPGILGAIASPYFATHPNLRSSPSKTNVD
ncbi:MAG: methylmalonic aciduria and homocystinuria type D protein [Leptolyngbyaceae bacterium]|nr:methylmalonic aciduria and homocystinuria type D protein [Leptolyngbyaceae bacterium]